MKRVTPILIAAAIAILLIPVAQAAGAERSRVVAKLVHETTIDVGEPGFSDGDYDVARFALFRHGHRVGYGIGKVTIVDRDRDQGYEEATLTFRGRGSIALQGISHFETPSHLAVTGGTGKFRRARGTVKETEVSEVKSILDIRVID